MKKAHLILVLWLAFIASGVIASIVDYIFPAILSYIFGMAAFGTTGIYFTENWDKLK